MLSSPSFRLCGLIANQRQVLTSFHDVNAKSIVGGGTAFIFEWQQKGLARCSGIYVHDAEARRFRRRQTFMVSRSVREDSPESFTPTTPESPSGRLFGTRVSPAKLMMLLISQIELSCCRFDVDFLASVGPTRRIQIGLCPCARRWRTRMALSCL